MEAVSERIAFVCVAGFLFAAILITLQGWRTGRIEIGGWGIMDRHSSPIAYWIYMGFHFAMIGVLAVLLVAKAARG